MTTFIVWPSQHDEEVRAAYFAAIGEEVQPDAEFNGTKYMVASSRATPKMLAHVPHVTYGDTPEEAGFDV